MYSQDLQQIQYGFICKDNNLQMEAPPINQQQIEEVLIWVDSVPLSRIPKNMARDFSDGVLAAELLHQSFPTLVHLHNYQSANSSASKYINWKTLNEKVLRKFRFQIHRNDIQNIIASQYGAIERVLYQIYTKVIYTQNRLAKDNQTFFQQKNQSAEKTTKNLQIASETMNYARQLSNQLADKQTVIQQLRQTIQILQTKLKKMEQLNKLKDAKIDSLMRRIDQNIGI